MDTIYHKLIQSEQELDRCDMTLGSIGRQILAHINRLNSNTWYTEFTAQDFFNVAGDKQAQAYMKTSNMIFILAAVAPFLVSEIKWPKTVCVLSEDGFVIPTNKPFPKVTIADILQKTSSFLTAPTKAEQEALAAQVNASL